jgi:hypothetical protein
MAVEYISAYREIIEQPTIEMETRRNCADTDVLSHAVV